MNLSDAGRRGDDAVRRMFMLNTMPTSSSTSSTSTSQLRSVLADDPDLAEILPIFVAELPQQVGRLRRLLEQRDVQELRRLIHQIKGCGGGYGFQPITELAGAAERQILADEAIEQVAGQVEALVQLMRRVEGYDLQRESDSSP